jgi:DNA-binding NarL/FixJ family response regulator
LAEFLHLGFFGTLHPDTPAPDLRRALHAVAGGELWFPRKVMSRAIRTLLPTIAATRLTAREREVLSLMEQGYSNREISEALYISRETVRWHVKSLNSKIGKVDRWRAEPATSVEQAPTHETDGIKVA